MGQLFCILLHFLEPWVGQCAYLVVGKHKEQAPGMFRALGTFAGKVHPMAGVEGRIHFDRC